MRASIPSIAAYALGVVPPPPSRPTVRRMWRPAAGFPLLVALLLLGMVPEEAAAQRANDRFTAPRWVGHATFLGGNAMLGALTAGVVQAVRGGDFQDGFVRGALGGAVAYTGRRVAVERFDGAGLLGRQVSAVGASIVRNAGEGRGTLERVVLPVGPMRFYLDRSDGWRVRPKVDLNDMGQTVVAAVQSETEFDPGASLSAGAPVFVAPGRDIVSGGRAVDGIAMAGVIVLGARPFDYSVHTFAHERVHVLQHDFTSQVVGAPAGDWLLARTRLTRAVAPYVDFDASVWLQWGLNATIEYENRPWEIEAEYLAVRYEPVR